VVVWHLMDPPRTEAAFAAALLLAGLEAWRTYLGLPLSGSRMPPGGAEELLRLGCEDAVLNLHGPVTDQAAEEFEAAFTSSVVGSTWVLGPWGVVGGRPVPPSPLLVLAESTLEVRAGVLVSLLVQLRRAVEAMGRRFGVAYAWSDRSMEVARRLDFVTRAPQIAARRPQPAVLLVVGKENDISRFREPTAELRDALAQRYADLDRVELVPVSEMGHQLAEEPGVDPLPRARTQPKSTGMPSGGSGATCPRPNGGCDESP
jgi:hypothetical protein